MTRDTIRLAVGKRTREAREGMGLTQGEFAARLRWGKSGNQLVSRIECGSHMPELHRLLAIKRLTGKPLDWLAGE